MALETRITLRLSDELQEKYAAIADQTGNTLSEVIRQVLLESNPQFIDKLAIEDRLRIIRLISKSSNNLNQIARQLNSLALYNQLHYDQCIHYLRILDTIEAQQHIFLKMFNDY